MFGPSINHIWTELAQEIGAEFKKPGVFQTRKMRYQVGEWEVVMSYQEDEGQAGVKFTAPFINTEAFRFKIYKEYAFSGIAKSLGVQDIEIGVEGFDERYIIQGNDPARVKQLFQDARMQQLIENVPKMLFYIADHNGIFNQRFPAGVDMLCFKVAGLTKEPAALKGVFALFIYTLKKLVDMGAASRGNPMVRL